MRSPPAPPAPPAAPAPPAFSPPPAAIVKGARDLVSANGCGVRHVTGVLSAAEVASLFASLSQLPWRTEVDAFGLQARETFFCADPGCTFAYVGLRLPPAAWPAAVLQARAAVARALGCSASLLSACLANNYRVGAGSIPWHYDEV